MKNFVFILLSTLFFLCTQTADAQKSRSQLERERKENQAKIEETNRILNETANKKQATLGQLNAIKQQVGQQREVVGSIKQEINILQLEINKLSSQTLALQTDLNNLKAEYAAMVYAASKADVYSKLIFLLSSETFNQFVNRLRYLRYYSEARSKQVQIINRVKSNLVSQQTVLEKRSSEQNALLLAAVDEEKLLTTLEGKQADMIIQLAKREKELKRELDERLDADRNLEKLIADMIRREVRRAQRAARAKAKEQPKENKKPAVDDDDDDSEERIKLTPETQLISNNFAENRGRIVWPVAAGFISSGFGKQPHPVLKNIWVDKMGVDIQTNANERVRSVFDGEVGFVARIPGMAGNIVSIIHGEYITVYTNLKNVNVRTGDKVKLKTQLGEVVTDKDGTNTMQFQVWKNNQKLDPESWLLRH